MQSSRIAGFATASSCRATTSRAVEAGLCRVQQNFDRDLQRRALASSAVARKELLRHRPSHLSRPQRPRDLPRSSFPRLDDGAKRADDIASAITQRRGPSAPQSERSGLQSPPRARISLSSDAIALKHDNFDAQPITTLKNGLDRVLFESGVHWLRDPKTGEYNFDERLATLPAPDDIHVDVIERYTRPSLDDTLIEKAKNANKRFVGSTSSLVHLVNRCILLFAGDYAQCRFNSLSKAYRDLKPVAHKRMPYSAQVLFRDGVYGIDPHPGPMGDPDIRMPTVDAYNAPDLLSRLGNIAETWVTSTPETFDVFRKSATSPSDQKLRDIISERALAFRYVPIHDMYCRSQIDGSHPDLPGQAFDIKSRSVLPLRYDVLSKQAGLDYKIEHLEGLERSFERETFDLIRLSYLNWSIQARLGGMAGIFEMYHNSRELFGFQYRSLADLDRAVMTTPEAAEAAFRLGLGLANGVLNAFADHFGGDDFCFHILPQHPNSGAVFREGQMPILATRGKADADPNFETAIGLNLVTTKSHFNQKDALWTLDAELQPIAHAGARRLLGGPDRLSTAHRLTLPQAVIETLTSDDRQLVQQHNLPYQPSAAEGEVTTLSSGFPLAKGVSYAVRPSRLMQGLRSTGTISPFEVARDFGARRSSSSARKPTT